jgi:hypothetical protein
MRTRYFMFDIVFARLLMFVAAAEKLATRQRLEVFSPREFEGLLLCSLCQRLIMTVFVLVKFFFFALTSSLCGGMAFDLLYNRTRLQQCARQRFNISVEWGPHGPFGEILCQCSSCCSALFPALLWMSLTQRHSTQGRARFEPCGEMPDPASWPT